MSASAVLDRTLRTVTLSPQQSMIVLDALTRFQRAAVGWCPFRPTLVDPTRRAIEGTEWVGGLPAGGGLFDVPGAPAEMDGPPEDARRTLVLRLEAIEMIERVLLLVTRGTLPLPYRDYDVSRTRTDLMRQANLIEARAL